MLTIMIEMTSNEKKGDFIARTNSILANFRSASRQAKMKLFKSKCCVFYGSQTWSLNSKWVNELEVCWRKAVRWLLDLPNTTRSVLLPHLLKCDNLKVQLSHRFLKLMKTVSASSNRKTKWITMNRSKTGTVQQNIEYLLQTWNITSEKIIYGEARLKTDLSVQSEHQKRAAAIIDFLDMMIDSKDDDIGNIDFILTYLCTY